MGLRGGDLSPRGRVPSSLCMTGTPHWGGDVGAGVAGDVFSLEGQGALTLSGGTVLTSTEQDPPHGIWALQPPAGPFLLEEAPPAPHIWAHAALTEPRGNGSCESRWQHPAPGRRTWPCTWAPTCRRQGRQQPPGSLRSSRHPASEVARPWGVRGTPSRGVVTQVGAQSLLR